MQKITKCRICGKLFKRPQIEFMVYVNYDPTCCSDCNHIADANITLNN